MTIYDRRSEWEFRELNRRPPDPALFEPRLPHPPRAISERLHESRETPAADDREAAGGRRIDARFVQGDAGVSIGRRALSRVVHSRRL
jgi:hypothetical protein